MTDPNGKHEFEAAIGIIEDARDRRKSYGLDSVTDLGAAIAALQDYPKVKVDIQERIINQNKSNQEIGKLQAELEKVKERLEWKEGVNHTLAKLDTDQRKELHALGKSYAKVKAENRKLRKLSQELLGLEESEWEAKVENYTKLEAEYYTLKAKLEKYRPLIEAARGVDKRAVEFYTQEAIEPRGFEISSRDLRSLYATGKADVDALIEALPERDK